MHSRTQPKRGLSALVLGVVLTVVFSLPVAAAAPGDQLWASRYYGAGIATDRAYVVRRSPDGTRVFVTGESYDSISGNRFATVAYTAGSGSQIWFRTYAGGGGGYQANPIAMAVSPDGTRVFVTGTRSSAVREEIVTIAYDATTGSQLWLRTFNPESTDGTYRGVSLVVGPGGGRVYVVGSGSAAPTFRKRVVLLAYSAATGASAWATSSHLSNDSDDSTLDLAISPDGTRLYVVGRTGNIQTIGYDAFLAAFDASTGSRQWLQTFDTAQHGWETYSQVRRSSDGTRVYVTGVAGPTVQDGVPEDIITSAYTASGTRLWTRRFDNAGHGFDVPQSLALGPAGQRLFIAGATQPGPALPGNALLLAYNTADGGLAWSRTYDGNSSGNDNWMSVGVSPDGTSVYVTGWSHGPVNSLASDGVTGAYAAADGAALWRKKVESGFGSDGFSSLVVGPAGDRVFTTGWVTDLVSGENFLTIAYAG